MKILQMLLILCFLATGSALEAQPFPSEMPTRLDLPETAQWRWLPTLMKSSGQKAWLPMTAFNGTQVVGEVRLLQRRGESWFDTKKFVPFGATPRLLVSQFRGNTPRTGTLKDWRNSDVAAFASINLWEASSLRDRFTAQPLAGMPVGSAHWDREDQSLFFVASHLGLVSCVNDNGKELWRFVSPGTLAAKRGFSQSVSSETSDRCVLPGGALVLFRWTSQRKTLLLCLASELRAIWCLDVINPEQPAFRWYREDLPEKSTPLLWGQASWSGEILPGSFPLAPLVVGQKIYVASQSESGVLLEINPLNGDSRVCCEVPDPLATPPVALLNKNQSLQAFFFCDVKGRFYRCQFSNNRWIVERLHDLFAVASFDGVIEPQLMVRQEIDGPMNFIVTARNSQRMAVWNIKSSALDDQRWRQDDVTAHNWWKIIEGESVGRPLLWNRQLVMMLRKAHKKTIETLSLSSNEPLLHLKSSEGPLLSLKIDGDMTLVTQDGEGSAITVERLRPSPYSGRMTRRYWRRLGRSE